MGASAERPHANVVHRTAVAGAPHRRAGAGTWRRPRRTRARGSPMVGRERAAEPAAARRRRRAALAIGVAGSSAPARRRRGPAAGLRRRRGRASGPRASPERARSAPARGADAARAAAAGARAAPALSRGQAATSAATRHERAARGDVRPAHAGVQRRRTVVVHAPDRRAAGGHSPPDRYHPGRGPRAPTAMPAHDPLYDLVLMLDSAAPDEQRAKVLAEVERTIVGGGEIVEPAGLGRAPDRVRDPPQDGRRVPPAAVPRATREVLETLQRTLRITDGVIRFRIIKLAPGTPGAAGDPPRAAPDGHRRAGRPAEAAAAPAPSAPAEAVASDAAFASDRRASRATAAT